MAVLRASRVILRPMNLRDRRFCASLYTDADLMEKIGPPLDHEQAKRRAHLAAIATGRPSAPQCYWVVEVGLRRVRAGLVGWTIRGTEVELGIIISLPWQRRGLSTISMRALLAHARGLNNIEKFILHHRIDNKAMAALARSLGFVLQGWEDRETCRWILQR